MDNFNWFEQCKVSDIKLLERVGFIWKKLDSYIKLLIESDKIREQSVTFLKAI